MKKILSVILFVLISLFPLTVSAKNESIISKDGLFEYQITENNDVKLTEYLGDSSTMIIPDKIDNKKVVSINMIVNYTDFETMAGIKAIKLNRYIKALSGDFFSYFKNLKKITVSKQNAKYSSKDGVLYNKDFTKIYAYPHAKKIESSLKILNSVKIIGNSAFKETDLQTVIIPKSVNKIGPYAFNGCQKLKKAVVHKNVTYIGKSAFCNCRKLSTIKICGSLKLKIGSYAFALNPSLKSVTLPEFKNTKYNYGLFAECNNLTKVIISDKVKQLPEKCFNDCRSLKTLYIPPTVRRIDKDAVGKEWNDAIDSYEPNPNFVIKGVKNSAAHKYAKKNGLKFKEIK